MPVRAFIVLDRLANSPVLFLRMWVLMPVRAFIVLDGEKIGFFDERNNRLNAREGIYCFG